MASKTVSAEIAWTEHVTAEKVAGVTIFTSLLLGNWRNWSKV
jgi:hypothetical protein